MKKILTAAFTLTLVYSAIASAQQREMLFGATPAPAPAPAKAAAPAPVTKPITAAPAPAPAAKAPTVATAATAAVPALPPLDAKAATKAPEVVAGEDPRLECNRLASTLKDGLTIGFYPSASGGAEAHSFISNYLPLANYLSKETGTLVTLVPERDLVLFAQRALDHQYPVLVINSIIAADAARAGYVPVASAKEFLTPAFVVRADSPLKTLNDLVGKPVAWVGTAQITMMAKAELSRIGLGGAVRADDVAAGGRAAAVGLLQTGVVDAALMRIGEAEAMSKDGKYRILASSLGSPAAGVWVRKEYVDSPVIKKMVQALINLPQHPAVAAGFQRGFGTPGVFILADEALYKPTMDALALNNAKWPGFDPRLSPDPKKVAENDKVGLTYPLAPARAKAGK